MKVYLDLLRHILENGEEKVLASHILLKIERSEISSIFDQKMEKKRIMDFSIFIFC